MDDLEKLLGQMAAAGGPDGSTPLENYANTAPAVGEQLCLHHPITTACAFAALLFDPNLQGSELRLEALTHMSLAFGATSKEPSAEGLVKAFADLGTGSLAHGEEEAEQLFVGLVRTSRGGFRILEGNWTGQSFHLQRIVELVEAMPDGRPYDLIRDAVFALLTLSDQACARAGLERYSAGEITPQRALSPATAARAIRDRGLVTFTADDLVGLGVDHNDLEHFVFEPDLRGELLTHEWGDTPLEALPLVETEEGFHLVLPTAVSLSIRRFVITQLIVLGYKPQLIHALGNVYRSWFTDLRTLGAGSAAAGMRFQRCASGLVASLGVQIDPGRFLQFILLLDDLEGFETDAFTAPRPNPNPDDGVKALKALIAMAHDQAINSGDYREGLTVIVNCGVGRPTVLMAPDDPPTGWRVEPIDACDLETLTRLSRFEPLRLWPLLEARERMEAQGALLLLEGGVAQLVGQAKGQEGHLLNHGELPDGCLDGGGPLLVHCDPYAVLRIRQEAARNWDPHVAIDIEGKAIQVVRETLPMFDEDRDVPTFIEEGLPLRGVFETERRSWWWRVENNSADISALLYRWQTLALWVARAAPVLEARFPTLPDGALEWRARFDAELTSTRTPHDAIDLDQARACLMASAEPQARILRTHANANFEQAFASAENIAERALVEALVRATARMVSHDLGAADLQEIVAAIVPGPRARQTHAIRQVNFRDYVRSSLHGSVVRIELEDDATARIGIGWKTRERHQGATIDGKADCRAYLNSLVTLLQRELIDEVRQFDRKELIGAVLRNQELAGLEVEDLKRTAAANLALHVDKAAVLSTLGDREAKLTAVSMTCRLILELAACECPVAGGRVPGKLDLARLMTLTSQIFHTGGDSDAIHWDAMPPQIRITPLGDIHAYRNFVDDIVQPYGRRNADVRFEDAAEDYYRLVEPAALPPAELPRPDPAFLAAVEETIGVGIPAVATFIDYLEDLGIETGQAVFFHKRSELLAVKTIGGEVLDPGQARAVIDTLSFLATPTWDEIPAGYAKSDRHIWRFRRPLSVLRRPLIPLDNGHDPTLAIAPGQLRQAWVYLLGNYHRGDFADQHLGPLLARWKKKQADQRGQAFSRRVAETLELAGWRTHCEVKMTNLLKRGLDRDYGDVDVLAYHPTTGRVAMIECKDLQYRKTYGEVAEQLADFRGGVNEKGKRDYLLRHLDRMDLARTNLEAVGKFLGVTGLEKVESHLVFRNPVPMKYALKRLEDQVTVTVFDELDRF